MFFQLKILLGDLSIGRSLLLLASLILSWVVATVIYRLHFHPLAQFPGPFWARISGFPAYLHTLRGDRHVWLWTLQQQYGPHIRIAPNSVLLNTPTAFKTIFNKEANVTKDDYYRCYPRKPEAVTTWNCIDSTVHARKRRVLNTAFSDKALRSAETFIRENIDRWCDLLAIEIDGREWSDSLNMAPWANHLIYDILGDLCFGKSFGMKEPDSELRYVPGLMTDFLSILHPVAFSPFASLWVWLKPRGLNWLLASAAPPALNKWETFVHKCFAERALAEEKKLKSSNDGGDDDDSRDGSTRKDFFHYLFGAVDAETGAPGYTRDELFGESEMLIIAGSDTTAIAAAASLFYLARDPQAQARIAAEVTAAFPVGGSEDNNNIRAGAALSSCRYLRAFLHEVLRLSPPVPADLPREVGRGGLAVDGVFLPAGVHVSSAAYCLHMRDDLYPDPFRFRPERWLVDDADPASAARVAKAEAGFAAFSAGPRACPGKNLAYLEMSLVLAKVVRRFEVRLDPLDNLGGGTPRGDVGRREAGQYQLRDIFVGLRDGPMIQLKKR